MILLSFTFLYTVMTRELSILVVLLEGCNPVAKALGWGCEYTFVDHLKFLTISWQLCEYSMARKRHGRRRIYICLPEGCDAYCNGIRSRTCHQYVD